MSTSSMGKMRKLFKTLWKRKSVVLNQIVSWSVLRTGKRVNSDGSECVKDETISDSLFTISFFFFFFFAKYLFTINVDVLHSLISRGQECRVGS